MWGSDDGTDIGSVLGASMWSEDDLDEAIETAEEEGYPPETIEMLKEERDEMMEYQAENDIQPLTDDPDVDPGDVGGETWISDVGDALNDRNVPMYQILPTWTWLLVGAVGVGAALWLLRPVLTIGSEVVA
ncbi:hypothetical protein [Halorubrum sp. DTA46]|uniref:hypothetical protein n=1 Tax=Halorubrum sp. DTA46 TaxID=3402162 RepID=UPI003AAA44AB